MIRSKHQPYVPTAFVPSHIDRQPISDRSHRGLHDFGGIPTLSDTALDETPCPLFAEQLEDVRKAEMAGILDAIRQRHVAEWGGTYTKDLR